MDAFGKRSNTQRVFALEAGGGALLEVGPYPMAWVGVSQPSRLLCQTLSGDDAFISTSEKREVGT